MKIALKTRTKKILANISTTAMYWVPEDGRRKRGRPKKNRGKHSRKSWKRWVLAGMEPAGSPVIVRDGDFSSPDAPRGTGGPKSSEVSQYNNRWVSAIRKTSHFVFDLMRPYFHLQLSKDSNSRTISCFSDSLSVLLSLLVALLLF